MIKKDWIAKRIQATFDIIQERGTAIKIAKPKESNIVLEVKAICDDKEEMLLKPRTRTFQGDGSHEPWLA